MHTPKPIEMKPSSSYSLLKFVDVVSQLRHSLVVDTMSACVAYAYVLEPVHTTPEEFENGGFTLETHQMLSVHTTREEFRNTTIVVQFGFVFEENSVKKIT